MPEHNEDRNTDERDALEVLAADFADRFRKGESPSISEYANQHPELADEIEELFPTISVVEQLKVHQEGHSGRRASLGGMRLERLGDFRILNEIGRGGMGIVYEAFQESLGRRVALKVLPKQSLLEPRQLERFRREAQTAARLHHTNIVPVFGVGEHDGYHYIVMQLIRGVGLDALLARLSLAGDGSEAASHLGQSPVLPRQSNRDSDVTSLARAMVTGDLWQPRNFDTESSEIAFVEKGTNVLDDVVRPLDSSTDAATENVLSLRDTQDDEASVTIVGAAPSPPRDNAPTQVGLAYWRSAATIGQQVAEALQYAHAHHTLHRDIKPANLLLDPQGVVWITDFGLAKAMEQDNVTQAGALVGTLYYMAPEQFSGKADARSDIYSLGLTLYELVTMRPAFDACHRNSLVGKITLDEPIRPRKVNPRIPRDLETIVLKAIARDPADRYQAAGDLAHDLECFLDDRPIRARRTPAWERLWRWARRNRALASLATSVLLLLLAVAVMASLGYVQTRRANIEEARQRTRAENTSALAIEALDNIFQQFAPDRTVPASALLVVGDKGEKTAVAVPPVLSKEAASLLEHMLAFYDRLAAQGEDDVKLRRKVAEANRRVGDIRQRLGEYDESKSAYLRAIDLYTKLADASTNVELRLEIARTYNELGCVYSATSNPGLGYQSFANALALLKGLSTDSSDMPQCRYELARAYYFLGKNSGSPWGPPPLSPGGRRNGRDDHPGPGMAGRPRGMPGSDMGMPIPRADSPGMIGPVPGMAGRGPGMMGPGPRRGDRRNAPPDPREEDVGLPPEELPPDMGPNHPLASFGPEEGMSPESRDLCLRKAIDLLERLVAEYPATPDYRQLLARCYREALPSQFDRRMRQTMNMADKATATLQKLVEEYPNVPDYRYDLSETYAWLGAGLATASPSKTADDSPDSESREMLEKALAISEELVAEHPNIPDYAVSQVQIRARLADVLLESDFAKAEASLRKAIDLQSTLLRRFPQNSFYKFGIVVLRESLAAFLQEHDRLPEARATLLDSIALLKETMQNDSNAGPMRGVLGHQYLSLADVLERMGDQKSAAEARRQAEAIRPPR
jgi:serine/threonine protein kinase